MNLLLEFADQAMADDEAEYIGSMFFFEAEAVHQRISNM